MRYYHSACSQTFSRTFRHLSAGDPCPKCNQPFARIVHTRCHCSSPHRYITDQMDQVGDTSPCPITGDNVVTISIFTLFWAVITRALNSLLGSAIRPLVRVALGMGLLAMVCYLTNVVVTTVDVAAGAVVTFVSGVIASIVGVIGAIGGIVMAVLPLFIFFAVAIGVILTAHRLLHAFASAESEDLSIAHGEAQRFFERLSAQSAGGARATWSPSAASSTASPIYEQNPAVQSRHDSATIPSDRQEFILNAIDAGGMTIRRQKRVIALLLIVLATCILFSYLSVDTVEEVAEEVVEVALMGLPAMLIGGFLCYAVFFLLFSLDISFDDLSSFAIGLLLSFFIGLATIVTMILVTNYYSPEAPTSQGLANALYINVVTSILIHLFERPLERLWNARFAPRRTAANA